MFWGAAIFVAALVGWTSLSAIESTPAAGAAVAWKLQGLNGKTVSSADFKGKVVVLGFWATWCPPCRTEIPSFIELQKQYGKDGLVIIGASVDDRDDVPAVKKFAQKFSINYPIVLADNDTARTFGGVAAIPTTFVIDREGRIVNRHVGLTKKSELEKEIKMLLHAGR